MIKPRVLSLALAGSLASLSPVFAQPMMSPPGVQLDFATSYSGKGDAKINGRDQGGELRVISFSSDVAWTHAWTDRSTYTIGVAASHYEVDSEGSTFVADAYQTVALRLGTAWTLSPEWNLVIAAQPGLYADSESLGSKAFNAPALAIASYRFSDTLTLLGGLRVDARSEYPVLPVIGVRWQATPQLSVSVGAPRTEVAFAFNKEVSVYGGASFQGGTFYANDPSVGATLSSRRLTDTYVDYREIRLGGGVRLKLDGGWYADFEAGMTVDRRFEYDDRDITVKIEDAPYVRAAIGVRF